MFSTSQSVKGLSHISADVNNYTPEFTQSSYNFYVSYYDPIGTTIAPLGSIEALDYDIGSYGNIQYSLDQTNLPSPSNYFQVSFKIHIFRKWDGDPW